MIFDAARQAIGQLFTPPFRSVFFKTIGLTLLLLIGSWFGAKELFEYFAMPWIDQLFPGIPSWVGWLGVIAAIVAGLGLALGLALLIAPVSAVVANSDILGVLHPGEHGSTFGGNPLAAAVGATVVDILRRGEFQSLSAELGERLRSRLRALIGDGVLAVRGLGLWAGVDIDPALGTGKQISMELAGRGVLVKDTHGSTLRFAPPLVITAEEIDWAVGQFADVLADAASR